MVDTEVDRLALPAEHGPRVAHVRADDLVAQQEADDGSGATGVGAGGVLSLVSKVARLECLGDAGGERGVQVFAFPQTVDFVQQFSAEEGVQMFLEEQRALGAPVSVEDS